MKKIIVIFLLLVSADTMAQDSTVVINLSLQARIIEYLTPYLKQKSVQSVIRNTEEPTEVLDGSYNLFLKWRAKFKATQPTNLTAVITDTIPTVILADLYNYTLNNPDGIGASSIMKSQIAAARSANNYLDRLCTLYEQIMLSQLIDIRKTGRRYLLGNVLVP